MPSALPQARGQGSRLPARAPSPVHMQAPVHPVGHHALLCDCRRTSLKNIYKNFSSLKAQVSAGKAPLSHSVAVWASGALGDAQREPALPARRGLRFTAGPAGPADAQNLPCTRGASGLGPPGLDSGWSLISAVWFCLDRNRGSQVGQFVPRGHLATRETFDGQHLGVWKAKLLLAVLLCWGRWQEWGCENPGALVTRPLRALPEGPSLGPVGLLAPVRVGPAPGSEPV